MEKRSTAERRNRPVVHTPRKHPPPCRAEVDEEEEKMEKFFELLKNIRSMKGQWKRRRRDLEDDDAARGRRPCWRPSFEREDFEPAVAGKKPEVAETEEEEEEEEGGGGARAETVEKKGIPLDLNLSL